MKISKALLNDSTEVLLMKLEGDINVLTAGYFRDSLMEIVLKNNSNILVDCKDLEYIDSHGLTILAYAVKKMQQKNLDIKLFNVRKPIMKLLKITSMDRQFNAAS